MVLRHRNCNVGETGAGGGNTEQPKKQQQKKNPSKKNLHSADLGVLILLFRFANLSLKYTYIFRTEMRNKSGGEKPQPPNP